MLASDIDENFSFSTIYEGKKDNLLISKFMQLEKAGTEYPHMIYDGAFSDGTVGGGGQLLEGEKEITKLQAEEIFKNAFSSYGVKKVELTGETNDKTIPTYNLDGELSDGTLLSCSISKKGGKLINFNNFRQAEEVKFDDVDTLLIAENFLKSLGIENMQAVWTMQGSTNDTYNFAYLSNGVIWYSDLIKVNVCRERGIVCSMEAKSYYLNHVARRYDEPKISMQLAKEKVNSKIAIQSGRLALIPKQNGKEVLAYEFVGTYNSDTYYVYINAYTASEEDIFKVVKTTEGELLS